MPRTIEEGFNDFLSKLTPIKNESDLVKSHRVSIVGCLENNFSMTRFFKTGSIGHGTSVSGYSDVDYFAIIPRDNLKENSDNTLRTIKEALINRFPNTIGIRVDSPAVVIPFGRYASETTEVIPADYMKSEGGYNIYDIPNGDGGWMKSSPVKHNDYVTEINKKMSYKVKPLIRFIKAWKCYRNVPISSFYLEMQTARYANNEESIVYSIDIRNIFKMLWDNQLSAMSDPTGISGYIHPCISETKKEDALSKLETALNRANKAGDAELEEDIQEAFEWWDLVCGKNFPPYYY